MIRPTSRSINRPGGYNWRLGPRTRRRTKTRNRKMTRLSVCLLALGLTALGAAARAQTAGTSPAKPPAAPQVTTPSARRQNPAPIVSPEVHADRTVVFRLRAPNATKVAVSGEWSGGEKEL